jgi:hypothetical protein
VLEICTRFPVYGLFVVGHFETRSMPMKTLENGHSAAARNDGEACGRSQRRV